MFEGGAELLDLVGRASVVLEIARRSTTPSSSQITTAGTMPETANAVTSSLVAALVTRRVAMTSQVALHHSEVSASAQPAWSL